MRLLSTLALTLSAAAVAACGDMGAGSREAQQAPATTNETMTSEATPTQAAADGAFGYTRRQLEDADIRSPDGTELGEVEAVITDASGAVVALAVEVEGPDPDPVVRLPLDGLTPVTHDDDRDLQTAMTREELRAMPAWRREG